MRHIIIGGSGFLGQYLADALRATRATTVIADVRPPDPTHPATSYVELDVTQPSTLARLQLCPDDVVHHLAARLLVPIPSRRERQQYFDEVNRVGTENVLRHMHEQGCRKAILFTTDMVYGHTVANPRTEDHPIKPIGPYGTSKAAAEDISAAYRQRGLNIAIFRPRLIIGRGRQGILNHLFFLIRHHLPVPLIGHGTNRYQFVAAEDCVDAALRACARSVPNETYNLGSAGPPRVRTLLKQLIEHAGSRSKLIPTPAPLVKSVLAGLDRAGLPLMDPEQYEIANEDCILDTTKAEQELGWQPRYSDQDMLVAAYEANCTERTHSRQTVRRRFKWRSA